MRPVFGNLPPWESLHQAWLGQIEFDDGLEREANLSYHMLFRPQKISFIAQVIKFSTSENTYNYITLENFNCIYLEIDFF